MGIEDKIEEKKDSFFWNNKEYLAGVGLLWGTKGLDVWQTYNCIGNNSSIELNPVARYIMEQIEVMPAMVLMGTSLMAGITIVTYGMNLMYQNSGSYVLCTVSALNLFCAFHGF